MPKLKQNNSRAWKPVALEGSVFSSGIEGLVGIEELTDYKLEEKDNAMKILICDSSSKNEKKKVRKVMFVS